MSFPLLAQALNKINEVAASVATAITNIAAVKTATDGARTDITAARDNINTATNAARDNNNTTTNAARDNIKTHVTSAVAGISLSAVKSVQQVIATPATFSAVSGGAGGSGYGDIPCSSVDTAKAMVIPLRMVGASNSGLSYRLISATTVRVEQYGSGAAPGVVACVIVEFK